MYYIPEDVKVDLINFFSFYSYIDKVVIFGSRARGDYNPKSDIDICIYSLTMSDIEFRDIRYDINELPILYHIDIVHFERVNESLQKSILKDEELFFTNR